LVVGPHRQTDARVEAHIFVAALAFLLHRAIEKKKLKAAGRGSVPRPKRCRSGAPSASSTSGSATARPNARSPGAPAAQPGSSRPGNHRPRPTSPADEGGDGRV